MVLDVATAAAAALAPVATLADETECFVYHDSRDPTGFIDGTENRRCPKPSPWRSFPTAIPERAVPM